MDKKKIDDAMIMLKEHGYKYTKKRESMLTWIFEEDRYVSAKELHVYMNQEFKGVSFDTIYRNLNDFVELNLLETTDLNGESKYRFSCCSHHHHHHFICTECGATKEIHLCPMDYFKEQLPNCVIESHRFEIYGKCEKCV